MGIFFSGGRGVLAQSQAGSREKPSQESLAELSAQREVSREKMVVRRQQGALAKPLGCMWLAGAARAGRTPAM